MKTEITTEEAERVAELIARHDEVAETMGINSRATDISEMSAEQIAADAEIDMEDAEVIALAATLADEPTLWGVFQFLFNFDEA